MLEAIIMLLGVFAGIFLLKLKNSIKLKCISLNNKLQTLAVILIIFIMGINLGSMNNFEENILSLGYQSILFALIPTLFSVMVVYIFTQNFNLRK